MPPDVRCPARKAAFSCRFPAVAAQKAKKFWRSGSGRDPPPLLFLPRERPNLPGDVPKNASRRESVRSEASNNEGNPSFGGPLPDLFPGVQNRYHPIREVATHKEPGKDKGRAQHRNTVARRKTAARRQPVQRSRASRVMRKQAPGDFCGRSR